MPSSPAAPAPTTGGTHSPSAPAGRCAAGSVDVAVSPGDPVRRELCVRPGAVARLVLRPRVDDKRWTGVVSSAPALVLVSGWQVDPDGTAHATLRCAGTRGGAARVTVSAKAPDIAGAPRVVFTLDVNVVPYTQNG
ncbi:acetyl-CoA synthetase [Streptomyces sp. NPDC001816]|uniref:acetyl-CoA synthetase n=1 Tax=Streptomyces sp. NPDC001816 TaxID=3364612 RepID=UPI0036B82877